MLFFLRTLRKCNHCWAFLAALRCSGQVFFKMDSQEAEVHHPFSHLALMYSGRISVFFFLKSMMTSFVLEVLRSRLFSLHHTVSRSVSSPPEMSPTTAVSSAYFTMVLLWWVELQSWVYRV